MPVRPAWIDATDLIGFYNPTANRYEPTPFLDNLLIAQQYTEKNRLYCLVLDEMNLGRVENYAADFLSRLEKARGGERDAELLLYSEDIKNRFLGNSLNADKDYEQLARIRTHMQKYPSRLPIPEGMILFGTINVDETTHLPSQSS